MVSHLSQSRVSPVGYQVMAHHPCDLVPSVARLDVLQQHAREAPQVALESGAQIVCHLYPLQVDRVVDVGPVRLALEPVVPDQRVVRPL